VSLVKTRTWQFARRQLTWFRHQTPARWAKVEADEAPERTAERLREWLASEVDKDSSTLPESP
jgi:tRNA A37 N6-isopentenylltransferase MiaA